MTVCCWVEPSRLAALDVVMEETSLAWSRMIDGEETQAVDFEHSERRHYSPRSVLVAALHG